MKGSKTIFIILLGIVLVTIIQSTNVLADVDNKPTLRGEQIGKGVYLEWAVEMLDEDVLYETGFEDGDELPSLTYARATGDREFGGMSFSTEDKYNGFKSLKVDDSYTNGNYNSADLNGNPIFQNRARAGFEDRKYVKNGTELSLSFRAKTTGSGNVSFSGMGGYADYGTPLNITFLENVNIGDKTVKVSDTDIFKRYLDENRRFHLASRKEEYTTAPYVTDVDVGNSTITVSSIFRGEFKKGDAVLRHAFRSPVSFGGRVLAESKEWELYNLNTIVQDYEDYNTLKRGFSLNIATISHDTVYIDDIKMGYATQTELYRDNEKIYEGKLSEFEDVEATDKEKPDKVIDYNVTKEGNKQVLSVIKPKDNGTEYEYRIDAISNDGSGKYSSETEKVEVTSGIKGYSYVIDKNKNTKPNGKINLTEGKIELDKDVYKNHYLHIQAIDNAGNVSEVSHIKLDKVEDIIPPTVELSQTPVEWTNENVTINVDATDKDSGIKSIMYVGENMIKNGDFSEGDKYWLRNSSNHVGETNIEIIKGKAIYYDTSDGLKNRMLQKGLFSNDTKGSSYYAEVKARGRGVINARYYNNTSDELGKKLQDEKDFNTYRFLLSERSEEKYEGVTIERIGHGYMEVRDVKVFASKDITDSKQLEVTDNGKYEFVVEDNAGNITTESITIDNIDKEAPIVDIKPNTTDVTHDNVTLTVDAKDKDSGIKKIMYVGEDIVRNGDFSEGEKEWTVRGANSWGNVVFKEGKVILEDNEVSQNRIRQGGLFKEFTKESVHVAEVRAKGEGTLNVRYSVSGDGVVGEEEQMKYKQNVTEEWRDYLFVLDRFPNSSNHVFIEKIGKGRLEVDNIKVYEQQNFTETRQLEVIENGTYKFVVEDNAGNITTETYTVDNIDKTISFDKPTVGKFDDITIGEQVKVASTDISPLTVKDWRDDNNDWEMNVSATVLTNGKHTLPNGTMKIKPVSSIERVQGSGEIPVKGFSDAKAIDSGSVKLIEGKESRGEYEIVFQEGALEIEVDPTKVKRGTYESTLRWDLVHAP